MKVKNKKIQLIHKEADEECFEILKSAIVADKVLKKYEINKNTLIEKLPEDVINGFLDFLSDFSGEHRTAILELIKKGKITLTCEDE